MSEVFEVVFDRLDINKELPVNSRKLTGERYHMTIESSTLFNAFQDASVIFPHTKTGFKLVEVSELGKSFFNKKIMRAYGCYEPILGIDNKE